MARDDYDDDYDDYDDEYEERPRRRRRRRPEPRRRRRPAREKKGFLAGLFGGGKPAPKRRRGRISFDDLDDDYDRPPPRRRSRRDDQDERDEPRRRREEPRRRRRPSGEAKTLVDVCKPLFAFVRALPVEPGQPEPDFLKFREGAVNEIQRIEKEAAAEDIELQDVEVAKYALTLFLDEQVLSSEWSAKGQWAAQPLSIALLNDPEGGVNFYRKLDQLRDDQLDVMKIYLFCLALGYRGMYITEEPRKREAKIEQIKQDLLRRIGEPPMESAERLFPEGYTPSEGVEDEIEPPPSWWVWASVGVIVLCVILWVGLRMIAKGSPDGANGAIDEFARNQPAATRLLEERPC